MLPPIAISQGRVVQVIALSVEPPIPRYLRNPRLGDCLSHSSPTRLLGIGRSSDNPEIPVDRVKMKPDSSSFALGV